MLFRSALRLAPLPSGWSLETCLSTLLPGLLQDRWTAFLNEWRQRGEALVQELCGAAAQWSSLRPAGAKAPNITPYAAKPTKDRVALLNDWITAQPPQGDYEAVRNQELLTGYFHPGTFCRIARKLEGETPRRLPQAPLMKAVAALVEGPAELALLHACHWEIGRAHV